MKILVVGGGGREHALVWKLRQSPERPQIWCAPGNAGINELANTISISDGDIGELVAFAVGEKIDLVVVGPEIPLAKGLADACREEGVAVFGPSQKAAEIESSKTFARRLMEKYGIPTPRFGSFTDPLAAKAYARELDRAGMRSVVKADGLAAGKGAIVAADLKEAEEAIDLCMTKRQFGEAGLRVVVEECLEGPELSILAITDGRRLVILPPAQDHKRVGEGDVGPNTGGMGAYSPVPIVTDAVLDAIRRQILEPAIQGMEAEGRLYCGVLYAGLMMCGDKPYVIEFNCRFGDPETQAVLPVVKEDLLPLLRDAAHGDLRESRTIPANGCALCVVMASGGYPGAYRKGIPIYGLECAAEETKKQAVVFHAGTAFQEERIVTTGGRVLGITGMGDNFEAAAANAYKAVSLISFENAFCRIDIGHRVRTC